MAERSFRNQVDARVFAKETAVSTKTVTKIYYRDGLWEVEGKAVSEGQPDVLPVVAALSQNDFLSVISKIRENLKVTESVDELLNFLDINYKKLSTTRQDFVSLLSYADRELYKNIPNLLTHLSNASDAIEDLLYVKSKEHATEMVYTFQELVTIFSEYGVAQCLRRHKQAMLDASEKLKSESVAKTDATLSQIISRLESNAGRCKCGNGRLVIRQSSYGYFWGCSNFPTCFFKRALAKSEMEVLGV